MHNCECFLYKIPIDLEIEPVINLHVNKPKKTCRYKSCSCSCKQKRKVRSKRKPKSCNCKRYNSSESDELIDKLIYKLIDKLCINNKNVRKWIE